MRRLMPLLVALALTGCGGEASHKVVPARIRPMAPVPSIYVTRPLPGKRVRVDALPAGVVRSSVRELAAANDGVHRIPLYVARARDGRLCLGTTAFFRCLWVHDAQPVLPIAGFAGMGTARFYGAAVGLVQADLTVRVDDKRTQLVTFRGFPWAAFVSEIVPGGPDRLTVLDPAGRNVSGIVPLKTLAHPCALEVPTCESPNPWWSAGDPLDVVPEELRATLNLAKTTALAEPLVQRVLGGRRWVVDSTPWYRCSGGLIGFVLDFHFAPRGRFEENWPTEGYDESSHTAYVTGVEHFSVSKVSGIRVNVDVSAQKVVGVDPTTKLSATDPHPVVHYNTLHVVEKLAPGGGADSGTCGG